MFDFANKWKPIFGMMEHYDGFSVLNVVDDEFVHSSFNLAMEDLKTRASYVWWKAKDQRAVNDYSIGMWSWYVHRSSTEKRGTPEDKVSLPAPTALNKAHKSKRTFVIHGDARVDGRIRVNKVPRKMIIRLFGLGDFFGLRDFWSYVPLLVAKLDLVLIGICRRESDEKERYIIFKYFL
jgi:hypothetical protein